MSRDTCVNTPIQHIRDSRLYDTHERVGTCIARSANASNRHRPSISTPSGTKHARSADHERTQSVNRRHHEIRVKRGRVGGQRVAAVVDAARPAVQNARNPKQPQRTSAHGGGQRSSLVEFSGRGHQVQHGNAVTRRKGSTRKGAENNSEERGRTATGTCRRILGEGSHTVRPRHSPGAARRRRRGDPLQPAWRRNRFCFALDRDGHKVQRLYVRPDAVGSDREKHRDAKRGCHHAAEGTLVDDGPRFGQGGGAQPILHNGIPYVSAMGRDR